MDETTQVAAGSSFRARFGQRNPAPAFALLGIGLVGAGFFVPDYERLLFAWGGTALFVATLLRLVTGTRTVPARVATDLQATTATNVRRLTTAETGRYVPEEGAVKLVVEGSDVELDPVGERLLATLDDPDGGTSIQDRLPVLVDYLINELELASEARAQVTEDGVNVTVTDSTVGTAERFDHPVVSVFGVGLARTLGRPIVVESTVGEETIRVTCRWS